MNWHKIENKMNIVVKENYVRYVAKNTISSLIAYKLNNSVFGFIFLVFSFLFGCSLLFLLLLFLKDFFSVFVRFSGGFLLFLFSFWFFFFLGGGLVWLFIFFCRCFGSVFPVFRENIIFDRNSVLFGS